jgi:hypothetical protein
MPSRSPVGLITLPGWVKGLNRDGDPFQLELVESPDALNVDFLVRGAVKKRLGYDAYDKTTPAASPRLLARWNVVGGTEHLFYVDNDGTILNDDGVPLVDSTKDVGAWTTASGYPVGAASLNDVIYFTALGTTTIPSFDGTSWASVTATAFDGTASRFPKAVSLATHHDRVFAANVKNAAGTRFPSRVHWSDALDAETWTAANFIDFDPDDGQEITRIVPLGEVLVVFKTHSIQLLTGKSEDSFTRFKIEPQLGSEAPGTIVTYSGLMFFFDPASGVWQFDGAGFTPQDEAMNRYILDGINFANRYKAHAFVWQSRYYLSVPWGADAFPSRTFVLDLRTKAWTEYDYGVTASTVFGNKLYGGGPRNVKGVYQLQSGLDDDGTAITANFKTNWLAPEGSPSSKHRIRRVDSTWTALAVPDVTLRMFRDFSITTPVYSQMVDLSLGGIVWGTDDWGGLWGGGRSEVASRTTGWGNTRFRAAQFEVFSDGATDDWQLNSLALVMSTLGRIRGEP